ncbi:MAG: hypothetical protein L0958_04240 [Candidatus Mariimomonas ferrooxydans]
MDTGVLKSILGFLIIGVLFYFVMRKVRMGGCCGHSHGESNNDKTKDPVCGMTVEEKNAAETSDK